MLEKRNKTAVKTVRYIPREQQYFQRGGLITQLDFAEYFWLEQMTDYISKALLIYVHLKIFFPN